MFDGSSMKGIRAAVSSYAATFDPDQISAVVAQGVVDDAIAAENMLATIKALAARRVADTELWKRGGDLSPAHQLARKSGTSVTRAKEALEAAGGLSLLPGLDAAARAGEVSSSQAGAIADAATKNPGALARLMRVARKGSLGELKDECARVKAAAERDPDARQRAIHDSRFVRQRTTADGAGEVTYRSNLEEVSEMMSIVRGFAQRVFEKARSEGRREPEEAYLADGLLNAARAGAGAFGRGSGPAGGGGGGSGAVGRGRGGGGAGAGAGAGEPLPAPVRPDKVVVRIDWDALVRGWPVDGEVCEIAGLGSVAVSAVETMIASGDVFLAGVVTKGIDVVNAVHLGRRANAWQRSALDWMNPKCTVLGCNTRVRLETDHREDWADTKITLLSLLDDLCGHHHDLKTHKGWALVAGKGKREMVPPTHLLHPKNRRAGPAPPVAWSG